MSWYLKGLIDEAATGRIHGVDIRVHSIPAPFAWERSTDEWKA